MAGNIVKWWKHKILGGYKQFSVQECTTDSEELMYHQVRASSSCSAPPDLLMVSDRENNIPLRSPVVNIITSATTTQATAHHSSGAVGSSGVQKHQQQHLQHASTQQQQTQTHKEQHQQQHQHCSKDGGKQQLKLSSKNKIVNTQQQLSVACQQQQQQQQQSQHHPQQQDEIDVQQQPTHQRHSTSHHPGKEERIRLEEFTCDVSVEGGKSTQPLQFSFTFYDLDGHHGKITKDDIVGIVYTIYESIGKSVVVPHCGSKTINVRLTVSPEGKSKSTTAATAAAAAATSTHVGGGGGKLKKISNGNTGAAVQENGKPAAGHGHGHTRRQHRYRPRKLIKSDDEDDDSNSDKEKEIGAIATTAAAVASAATTSGSALIANNMSATVSPAIASSKSKNHSSGIKYNKMKSSTKAGAETAAAAASTMGAISTEQQQLWYQEQTKQQQQQQQEVANATESSQQQTQMHLEAPTAVAGCAHENIYENMTTTTNLKCCTKEAILKIDDCRSCEAGVVSAPLAQTGYGRSPTDVYMRQASTRVKMLRKARKQKFQDHCNETRQRSLSVGSEVCWNNRHVQQQQQKQGKLEHPQNQQQLGDVVDGVQLRHPHKNSTNNAAAAAAIWTQRQRNSAECWKTALNRNELMSIIRESMEKNRLCFQMNGKPQANVSPIRQPQHPLQQPHSQQRQRSNTVSKIPTLIANHSNAVISPSNNNNNVHNTNVNNNNNNHHHHHHQHQHNHSHNNSKSNSSSHSHSSNHTNNNSSELNLHDISTNNTTTQYHPPQPHIPIYHQQMAINPAVLAAQSGIQHGHHSKMNLCGYDSFLHATICGGSGASHSPPPGVNTLAPPHVHNVGGNGVINTQQQQQQQLIATVQPIMTVVPSSNSTPAKVFLNSTTHQIKTSKILRSGSYSQQHAQAQSLTAHSSPQYHGYQRLSSSSAHHGHNQHNQQQQQHIQQLYQQCSNKLAALNLASAQLERPPAVHIEKWLKSNKNKQQRKDTTKYTDNNLLYAKLSEKLQESALKHQSRSENGQRRKHKSAHKLRAHSAAQHVPPAPQQEVKPSQPTNGIHSSSSNTSIGNCVMLIPMHGDPAECENLIAPTTTDDDDALSEAPIAALYAARKVDVAGKSTTIASAYSTNTNLNTNSTADDALEINKESDCATADLLDLSDEAELMAIEAVESDVTLRASDAGELDELNSEQHGVRNYEDDERAEEEDEHAEENGGCASLANTSGGSGSLIHRYVHEHIHHHYHHFEEKDDKM